MVFPLAILVSPWSPEEGKLGGTGVIGQAGPITVLQRLQNCFGLGHRDSLPYLDRGRKGCQLATFPVSDTEVLRPPSRANKPLRQAFRLTVTPQKN